MYKPCIYQVREEQRRFGQYASFALIAYISCDIASRIEAERRFRCVGRYAAGALCIAAWGFNGHTVAIPYGRSVFIHT